MWFSICFDVFQPAQPVLLSGMWSGADSSFVLSLLSFFWTDCHRWNALQMYVIILLVYEGYLKMMEHTFASPDYYLLSQALELHDRLREIAARELINLSMSFLTVWQERFLHFSSISPSWTHTNMAYTCKRATMKGLQICPRLQNISFSRLWQLELKPEVCGHRLTHIPEH